MNARPEVYPPRQFQRHDIPDPEAVDADEISLIDLWLVLVRRRKIIAAVTASAVIAGLAYVLFIPPRYEYTTTIEIGAQIMNERATPIEGQDSVRAKLAESYIPTVVQEYQSDRGQQGIDYEVTVNAPKNSQVLVLTSRGTEDQEQAYKTLHQLVVQKLEQDHQRVSNVLKKGLEVRVAERERKIAALQEEAMALETRIKRIEDERALLALEIEQTENSLANAQQQRTNAVSEVTDATRAMTLLMISDQLRQSRQRLTELKQRLVVELPNKRDKLEIELSDNRRSQENEQAAIESVRSALVGMLETRAITPPLRLAKPVGPRKAVVLSLSLMLGLMLGVFLAFFSEFLSKVNGRMDGAT